MLESVQTQGVQVLAVCLLQKPAQQQEVEMSRNPCDQTRPQAVHLSCSEPCGTNTNRLRHFITTFHSLQSCRLNKKDFTILSISRQRYKTFLQANSDFSAVVDFKSFIRAYWLDHRLLSYTFMCRRRKPLALILLLDQGRWNEILMRASRYMITKWRSNNATQQTRNQICI